MKIPTGQDEGEGGGINLTPLIDVVFLLLIFFMVTASFQEDERDLKISVPEAGHGDPIKDLPELLEIGVRKDGRYSVGTRDLDREEIEQLLRRAKAKNGKQRALIRVDRDAAFNHFVFVFDLCKGVGVQASVGVLPRGGS